MTRLLTARASDISDSAFPHRLGACMGMYVPVDGQ